MLRWPTYEQKQPDNQTDPVGNAVKVMTERALASSAANARQLQQVRADEAKRQRQEAIDAVKVLSTEFKRNDN